MDYIAFCHDFYTAANIPVSLLLNGRCVYSAIGKELSMPFDVESTLYAPDHNPEFCAITPDLEYGRVVIEGTGYDMILGPIFTVPDSDEVARRFIAEQNLPANLREQLSGLFRALPHVSHPQLLHYLVLLHRILNGKECDVRIFFQESPLAAAARARMELDQTVDAQESQSLHNSYAYEMHLYYYIRHGRTAQLTAFLQNQTIAPYEPTLARSPLRQAKNLFLSLTGKAALIGAIPGGLEPNRVYQLIETYTLECEQCQSIEDVGKLQYIFLLDLCRRVEQSKTPSGISSEISRCMDYIRAHVNEPIAVDDVADHIHRSSSWLMRHFKEEAGEPVASYITRCRLEEAAEMLRFSDMSLADIAAYLSYSSQSHFQNAFKKQYNLTPAQYRQQKQITGQETPEVQYSEPAANHRHM